jgi:quercetin 2,3-dioxygenase
MSHWGNDELASVENETAEALTLDPRIVKLTTRTGVEVKRTLPHRELRTIGAWCFVDHFGPTDQKDAMSVAAHPHTGLQTASWLFSGEIEHRDSIGSVQLIRPGELNLMTAGNGIAHAELSVNNDIDFHGVQLWIALPNDFRNQNPHFEHHKDLPQVISDGNTIKVFVGELLGAKSPAAIYSEIVGAQINLTNELSIHLQNNFEYGFLITEGDALVNGIEVNSGQLHYLPTGNEKVKLTGSATVILLGGVPLAEKILMWWNFIGRSHDEIVQMRQAWINRAGGFNEFADNIGGFIPVPEMPALRLTARSNR